MLAKNKLRQYKKDPVNLRDGANGGFLSKEELFKTVLHQQEHLYTLEMKGDDLETDLRHWEYSRNASPDGEILRLEQLIQQNESELNEEEYWQSELRSEKECERKRQEKVRSLQATMEEYTQKIRELTLKTEALEREIQWEIAERAKRAKEAPLQSPAELEEMAAIMKRDLDAKARQSVQLENSLETVGKALEEAEQNLQVCG